VCYPSGKYLLSNELTGMRIRIPANSEFEQRIRIQVSSLDSTRYLNLTFIKCAHWISNELTGICVLTGCNII
jgi:hypothetical protein